MLGQMFERTRNTVARRGYEVVREGRPEAPARFRRLDDADRAACRWAWSSTRDGVWLVVRTRRGERTDVVRRIDGGPPPPDDGAGDRFPRRPRRPLGSGSVALPRPDGD